MYEVNINPLLGSEYDIITNEYGACRGGGMPMGAGACRRRRVAAGKLEKKKQVRRFPHARVLFPDVGALHTKSVVPCPAAASHLAAHCAHPVRALRGAAARGCEGQLSPTISQTSSLPYVRAHACARVCA